MSTVSRCLAAALIALWPLLLQAAPSPEVWPRWEAHDPRSGAEIAHYAWTRFLEEYLRVGEDGIARVKYGDVSAEDDRHLDAYIEHLASVEIANYSRDQQLAYWINLYNALTVDIILQHHPLTSIRDIDISPGLFSSGPWGAELIAVDGVALTLDDIEHRILRPIWGDPRIHYAVNCASLGCPNLQPVAFTSGNTDRLLDHAAHDYVNHPRGVAFEEGELIVSSIYEWFQVDFGDSEAGVIDHLEKFAEPPLRARLSEREHYDDHRYDWRLNGVR